MLITNLGVFIRPRKKRTPYTIFRLEEPSLDGGSAQGMLGSQKVFKGHQTRRPCSYHSDTHTSLYGEEFLQYDGAILGLRTTILRKANI